jgi:hypothetical protein
MCSRICGDFGRHTIQTAPTPAAALASVDTTVSTRRGIHHGCGTSLATTRRTTPRSQNSPTAVPSIRPLTHARMRLRYPAREGIKPEAGEAKPHNPPHQRTFREVRPGQGVRAAVPGPSGEGRPGTGLIPALDGMRGHQAPGVDLCPLVAVLPGDKGLGP